MDLVYTICKSINRTITDRHSDPEKYVEEERSDTIEFSRNTVMKLHLPLFFVRTSVRNQRVH